MAAYIPPAWEASVRLANAVIFANGGFHIEIGELNGMLCDPYFPKYQPMSSKLIKAMRDYYDFLVRYGNVLHDAVEEVDMPPLVLDTVRIGDRAEPETVWAITKRKDNLLIINLVNFLGASCLWREEQEAPRTLKDIHAKVFLPRAGQVTGVYLASPDFDPGKPRALSFKHSATSIEFTIPRLEYWDLLVFVFKRGSRPVA